MEAFFLRAKVTGKVPATTDAAVRNPFRRMGGLPHVRGKLSVLADCPISCAWWRRRVARLAVAEYSDASRDERGLPAKEFQAVVRELATFGTTLCFDTVPWTEMREIVARAVAATRSAESPD